MSRKIMIEKIGEKSFNKSGSIMEIIEYKSSNNILVQFENGFTIKTTYANFKKREVKSPYDKIFYDAGYLGEGKYKTTIINKKHTIQYTYWINLIRRCYDKGYQERQPRYKSCTICEEWLNFQVFAEWFDKNWYEISNEKMDLDKDILIKGNKIYSPKTCIIVPHRINILFAKKEKSRGDYPIGVCYRKDNNKFRSYCGIIIDKKAKQKHLGYFDNPNDAFYKYKDYKENYIKQIAEEYRDKIPKKLYDAMYGYEVEITD